MRSGAGGPEGEPLHRLLCATCVGLLACNGAVSAGDGGASGSPPPLDAGYASYVQGGNPVAPMTWNMYVELFHFVEGPIPTSCVQWSAPLDAGLRSGQIDYALEIQMCTDGGPIAPGTYPINNTAAYCTTGMGSAAVIQTLDAKGATGETTNTGTVTVTSVGTSISGSYSAVLTFGNGETVTGTFDVPICP